MFHDYSFTFIGAGLDDLIKFVKPAPIEEAATKKKGKTGGKK